MKKILIKIGLIALVLLGWGVLSTRIAKEVVAQDASPYLAFAEEQLQLEAYGSAINNLKKAVEIDNSVENRMKLAEVYKEGNYIENYKQELHSLIMSNPSYFPAYEELVDYYYSVKNYSDCSDVIQAAINRGMQTTEMVDIYYICNYRYILTGNYYDNLHNFYNNISVAYRDDRSYYLNENLEFTSEFNYDEAYGFLGSIGAVSNDGSVYFVDKEGKKYLDTMNQYTKAYSFSEGLAVVVRDKEYYYINGNLKEMLGPYQDATTFSSGIAAVRVGDVWRIIDSKGDYITKEVFDDILIDEENQCSNQKRFFGKQQGVYYMFQTNGKRVSSEAYEYARPFYTDQITAVKKDGLWGFIGINGAFYIEPQYEDARAFGMKIGAVCTDGLWGFVNVNNRFVIPAIFDDAKSMSENKMVPINDEGYWRFLKLVQ